MKLLFENFRKYVNEGQEEDLNTQIALKIARGGMQDTALGMSDDDLKDLVVYIYDKEFDETGEGWDPYDEDLAQIRDVLTPDDQEDREEYGIEEMIREAVKKEKKKLKLSKSNIKKVFKKEGGALGLAALVDAIDAPKSKIKKELEDISDVGKHTDGDYIEDDDKEIDFKKKETIEEMIREEIRMVIEKRKKRKKRKKSKSKKRKGNEICAAGIAWAKRTFDTYPSAYANLAASKYCKDPNYAKGSKKKSKSRKKRK